MQLGGLGWRPFFANQLDAGEASSALRVVGIHRQGLTLSDGAREYDARLGRFWYRQPAENRPAVGDWVLADENRGKIERCLKRQNVLRRMAAGSKADLQLVGANVDTLVIVSSCNAEFSAARLQRYLGVAANAGIEPMIVLTKADLAASAGDYGQCARQIAGGVAVEVVNALDAALLGGIRARLRPAHTAALLGSSGVGKTTLLNTLAGTDLGETRAVREADGKGRHTTTSRWLHRLPEGALVLDGPGVREFGVAVGEGDLSTELEALARKCRFADCRHQTEPGCSVQAAIAAGRLQRRQVENYLKLLAERERHATALVARDRRARHIDGRRRRLAPAAADE